jgi:hypothetical protein
MDTTSSKPRRRKTMRVATIFTGVAATTAGVMQVAHAQDIRPAGTQDIRPGHAALPAGRLSGSIRSAPTCGDRGIDKNWLHVSTTFYIGLSFDYTSVCFGFRGTFQSPPDTGVRAECGGNNHGFLLGVNGGRSKSFLFGPGTTYHRLSWSHLYTVAINSWTGADACPRAPDFGGGSGG